MPKRAATATPPIPRKAAAKKNKKKNTKQDAQVVHVWTEAQKITESVLEHVSAEGNRASVELSLGLFLAALVSIGMTSTTEGHDIDEIAPKLLSVALKGYREGSGLMTH